MRKVATTFLWMFVFSIPLDRLNLDALFGVEAAATVTRIVGGVAFLAGFTYVLYSGRFRRFDSSHFWIFLFILWAGLSGLWSLYPEEAIGRAITYVQLAVMVWLLAQFAQKQEEQVFIMTAYISGAFVVGGSLVYSYFSGSVAGIELFPGRYSSFGYDPNDMALMLAIGIPMAWFLFMQGSGLWSWIGFFYVPLALMGVMLAASRGGMLASIISLLIIPFSFMKLGHIRRFAVIGLIIAGIVGILTLVPEYSLKRLMTIDDAERMEWSLESLGEIESNNMRLTIWRAGLDVFKDHPVVGVGAGGYQEVVDPIAGENFVAHNIFVSILVELGVIGCFFFVAMLVTLAAVTRYMEWDERLFWGCILLTYLAGGFFLTWEHTKQTWLIMGLIAARAVLLRPRQRKQKGDSRPMNPLAMIMTSARPLTLAGAASGYGQPSPRSLPTGSGSNGHSKEAAEPERQRFTTVAEALAKPPVYEQRQHLVIQTLLVNKQFLDDEEPTAFLDHLVELDETWSRRESAANYFRKKLGSDYPHTMEAWYEQAKIWDRELKEAEKAANQAHESSQDAVPGVGSSVQGELSETQVETKIETDRPRPGADVVDGIYRDRKELVVYTLVEQHLFSDEEEPTALLDYLVELDETWSRRQSVTNYFRQKLGSSYPHTMTAWRKQAEIWAAELAD